MKGKVICLVMIFLFLFSWDSLYGEDLLAIKIVKWTRPHILWGEVVENGESFKTRIRLAGVVSVLGNDKIYKRALERVRELTKDKEAYFDFALGHGPEEKVWVGYIYLPSENPEESIILNALLLQEGLATLDEKDVGRNLLGYFIESQEEAREKGIGVWEAQPIQRRRKDSDCPSCVIR
ncbi:MAG: thermonuclease family protein [Candidatus Caldatribacteriaceae bacterium]